MTKNQKRVLELLTNEWQKIHDLQCSKQTADSLVSAGVAELELEDFQWSIRKVESGGISQDDTKRLTDIKATIVTEMKKRLDAIAICPQQGKVVDEDDILVLAHMVDCLTDLESIARGDAAKVIKRLCLALLEEERPETSKNSLTIRIANISQFVK